MRPTKILEIKMWNLKIGVMKKFALIKQIFDLA